MKFSKKIKCIVGTYTDNQSKGMYYVDLNTKTVSLAAEIDNPSYMVFSSKLQKLYVVSESNKGKISCFSMEDTKIVFENSVHTNSAGLAHVIMDKSQQYLFCVSYGDAKVLMVRLTPVGLLDTVVDAITHFGSSVNVMRQERAHAHSVWLAPDSNTICVCDLGTDEVVVYRIDYDNEKLKKVNTIKLPDGVGPRHLVFHSNGRFMYVLVELTSEVFVISWNFTGEYTIAQCIQLLDEDAKHSFSAAIRISSDGNFLYTSCRGIDVIVVFKINTEGLLERVQSIGANGKHPRDFILSADEAYLLCTNKDSNSISVFNRSAVDGLLTFRASIGNIPSPIAIIQV